MYEWIEKTASSNFLSLDFTEWYPKKLHIMYIPFMFYSRSCKGGDLEGKSG